ncbi:type II toxin-antitoxin system prevent-host-death family antitoxin [Nonomuraea rubra]|uniref:Antitoxin n=1 Tax=Nonomuraea rubra TaxID=46180 RepID=A0A7X0U4X8_9ACTN|nr:type II toxin-antitoxin system prevent-host-death family antitoxin [Nonomuraea rubra]MBB6555437.1 antitoxin YefM [Nonomuraea rubra]
MIGEVTSVMYIITHTWAMKVMTMSESRANYAATLDSVIDDQEEVLITRPGGEGVVMVSQRENESMRETLYLMASPVNRRRLSEAVARLEARGGAVRELADEHTAL